MQGTSLRRPCILSSCLPRGRPQGWGGTPCPAGLGSTRATEHPGTSFGPLRQRVVLSSSSHSGSSLACSAWPCSDPGEPSPCSGLDVGDFTAHPGDPWPDPAPSQLSALSGGACIVGRGAWCETKLRTWDRPTGLWPGTSPWPCRGVLFCYLF